MIEADAKFLEALRDLIRPIVREIIREEMAGALQEFQPAQGAYNESVGVMTVQELYKRYNIAPSTQRQFRRERRLKFIRVGRRPYYLPEHVAEFFESYRKGARAW